MAGTSRIAFGPAHTTAIGVRPSSSRSDEMSSVGGAPGASPARAPRWTPPIPPVAKTAIPAACAAIIVAETVVAAQPPSASAAARLGRAALRTEPAGAVASASSAASSSPTSSRPPWIATVAGTAPPVRTAASEAPGDLEVLRVRQAVADQRRFEGDDRPALRQRRRDLRVRRRGGRGWSAPVMPSDSSARGVVSWRAAARCPASAARWSAAAGESPAVASREPADEEPGIERVAGAGGVDRGDGRGRDLEALVCDPPPAPGRWRPSRRA